MLIETMNNQEAFDKALIHLRKQGKLAKSEHSSNCYYRDPDNHHVMCAVGCLLTDAPDITKLDLITDAKDLLGNHLDLDLDDDQLMFFEDMQESLHDNLFPHEFALALELAAEDFAKRWKLTYA